MAHLASEQGMSRARARAGARTHDRLHPAIGLAGGFGLIFAGAFAVHVIFNALI